MTNEEIIVKMRKDCLFGEYSNLTDDEVFRDYMTFGILPGNIRLTEEQKNDKELLLEMLKYNGYSYYFAPDELKHDKKVCIEAVKNHLWTIDAIPSDMFGDKKFINGLIEAAREWSYRVMNFKKYNNVKKDVIESLLEFEDTITHNIKQYNKEHDIISNQDKEKEIIKTKKQIDITCDNMKLER